MKSLCITLLTLAFLAPMAAKSQVFAVIPYRANDPFVFCTQGWSPVRAAMGWMPAPPYTTGLIIPLHPTWWWSSDDWVALAYYQSVCPSAVLPGAWTGPEPAQMAPMFH